MKKTHFDHLLAIIPDLARRRILDLGAGKGEFVVDAALRMVQVIGLEYNPSYIEAARNLARERDVSIEMMQGAGESLPFPDASFDFVNMSEVIEHVADPMQTLNEVYRVLAPGGIAYVSAPNRYGYRDPHFHLYGVNWLPRSMSDWYIHLFNRHKQYTRDAGHQRLRDMHYYRYARIAKICSEIGFRVHDIRLMKIDRRFTSRARHVARYAYYLLRPWYFDTFHLLLYKEIHNKGIDKK